MTGVARVLRIARARLSEWESNPAWSLLRQTTLDWNRHAATRLGASLAFYAVLSLAPLVILTIVLGSLFVGVAASQRDVSQQFQQLLGPGGADAIGSMVAHARQVRIGSIASVVGLLTLLFGASQVFAELQSALNDIWEVDANRSRGWLVIVRRRFLSFGLVLAIGLLLLVSLIVSAALAALGGSLHAMLHLPEWLLHSFDFAVSMSGTALLFALIFRYIPDARTDWRRSLAGGLLTATLFSLGKTLIGLYLGTSGIGSAYGAAGSLVVVIVWVYYSAQILFFGAEFTHVLAHRKHAVVFAEIGAPKRSRTMNAPPAARGREPGRGVKTRR